MDMVVKSMEMVVEAMEMALGALPHPGKVPKQRLLSPEICRWRGRSCRTLSRKTPIDLGFGVGRLYIGERQRQRAARGTTPPPRVGKGGTPALGVAAPWPPLRLSFGPHLASGKIGGSGFISSNSENISYVTFLKHKNSRK
jgi:hypothetical protein